MLFNLIKTNFNLTTISGTDQGYRKHTIIDVYSGIFLLIHVAFAAFI